MRSGDWQFNVRLRVLCLAGNRIASLRGGSLEKNSLLRELDISNNAVDSLEPLPHLKCLDTLNVSNNQLRSLEGIQRAPHLVVLHAEVRPALPASLLPPEGSRWLALYAIQYKYGKDRFMCLVFKQGNKLQSLEPLGLGRNGLLRELYIQQNSSLEQPLQLSALKSTDALQSLQVSPGPIVFFPHWRLHCVHMLPQLLQIDGVPITAEEQVRLCCLPSFRASPTPLTQCTVIAAVVAFAATAVLLLRLAVHCR